MKRGKRELGEFLREYLQPGSQIHVCRPNEAILGGELRVTNLTAERSFQLKKKNFLEKLVLHYGAMQKTFIILAGN